MQFTCSQCGEVHEGGADLAFDAPYYYYTVPEPERADRCKLGSDLCSIDDEDFFVRGLVEIPILGTDERFAYGVWTSLSRDHFERYVELCDDPRQSEEGPYFGWFSNRIAGYPETLNLKLMAHLRDEKTRPFFVLEPTDHPLALEQRRGISSSRLQEILETHTHR